MEGLIQKTAYRLGVGIVTAENLDRWYRIETDIKDFVDLFGKSNVFQNRNKAQLNQDIFVLLTTNFKRNGFFVEFGATNGYDLSNTYLLEKSYNWNGILAEPATIWHKDLLENRDAHIDFSCVWNKSNEILRFNMVDNAELSTISKFNDKDHHSKARLNGVEYDVKTISLIDLLKKYDAPKQIDYLSIDTEGSEFDILNNFEFDKYDVSIISCEHNFTPDREKIHKLLVEQGYTRRFTEFSKWDDWYFKI
jgi:FkbM family methyltransferase